MRRRYKKRNGSRSRQLKPVKLSNPAARLHTVHVAPIQAIKIELDNPKSWLSNVSNEARFAVAINSDFLVLEDTLVAKGTHTYTIVPKYDLTEWAKYSEVHLGVIEIKLVDNTDSLSHCVKLCVIQSSPNSNEVITVVNPRNQDVKIQPHQLLEVVCFESEWNNWKPGKLEASGMRDRWEYTSLPLGGLPKEIELQEVRYDVAGDHKFDEPPREGIYVLKNRFHLIPNPKLLPLQKGQIESELKQLIPPLREHHWWLGFSDVGMKKISDLINECYDYANLKFRGHCDDPSGEEKYTALREMGVHITVHGKNKHKMHPYFVNPDSVEQKMEMCRRMINEDSFLLINPLSTDQVNFHFGFDKIDVEIAQPSMFWSDLADDAEWTFEIDESKLSPNMIRITKKETFSRCNKKFQRFRIDHNYARPINAETRFLGAVNVICPPKEHCHGGLRRVSCWMTPVEKVSKIVVATEMPQKPIPLPYRGAVTTSGNSATNICYTKTDKQKPKLAIVSIKEIDFENLEDGAKAFNFEAPDETSKKNFTGTTSIYRSESERSSKESTTGIVGSGNGNEKSTSTGNEPLPTLVVSNFCHLGRVDVEYGQDFILKLNSPTNREYLWTVRSDKPENLRIEHLRMINECGELYQEALITPQLDSVPLRLGFYHHGSVYFEQPSGGYVTVFVRIKVTERTLKRENPEFRERKDFNIINSIKSQSASEFRLVNEWRHKDSYVLDPNKNLFLRVPICGDQWDADAWTSEVQREPYPSAVLRELGKGAAAGDFGKMDLWKYRHVGDNKKCAVLFSYIPDQLERIEKLAGIVATELKLDKLLIARVIFRNSNSKLRQSYETSVGSVRTYVEIEREFGIYLNCKKKSQTIFDITTRPPTTKTIEDPSDMENVSVRDHDTLIIKFSSPTVAHKKKELQADWWLSGFPSWMHYHGLTRENGKMSFRFTVVGSNERESINCLRFCCYNSERKLMVRSFHARDKFESNVGS